MSPYITWTLRVLILLPNKSYSPKVNLNSKGVEVSQTRIPILHTAAGLTKVLIRGTRNRLILNSSAPVTELTEMMQIMILSINHVDMESTSNTGEECK